ncbi:MAG: HEPN domain-containing protein [Planctomycetota bacterium]
MPRRDRVIAVVREWIEKAENDLKNGVHTLKLGPRGPMDTVCFHAQQCLEKYLKALLASEGIDFPKTHDVGEILTLASGRVGLEISVSDQRRFTAYATVTRYPGTYEPITLAEARSAVSVARRLRGRIRTLLPAEALRQRKKR